MTLLPLSLSSLWPEGLKFIRGTFFLFADSNKGFKPEDLTDALSARGIATAAGSRGISAPIQDSPYSDFRGSLTVAKSEDDWMFQWTLSPSSEPWRDIPNGKRAARIDEFAEVLVPFLPEGEREVIVGRGQFNLNADRWRPTALPVSLPGILEGTQGRPEITGFAFRFTEPTSELRSANVELVGPSLLLELSVAARLHPTNDLAARVCSTLGQNVSVFAVKTNSDSHG
jgi:hypothetical protein